MPQKQTAYPYADTQKISEAAMNPYADIVGNGPYGQDQASYTSSSGPPPEPKAMHKEKKKVEFTPYFDPSETRNDDDLRSHKNVTFGTGLWAKDRKNVFRPALGAKDENTKLRQEATQRATAKCDEEQAEKLLQLFNKEAAPINPPKTPVRRESGVQTPSAPMKSKGILKDVAIPGSLGKRNEVEFETPHPESKPLSAVVEAPSPLKLSTKKQDSRSAGERTPTLDHIRKLRAEEQAKTLAALEGVQQTPQVSVQEASSSTYRKKTSREGKRRGIEFLPNVDLGDSIDWGKSLHDLAAHEVDKYDSDEANGASSSVYSSDADDEDEIDKLTKAIAGMRPFQNLPSPTPLNSFQRQSAVPEGLDLGKIKALKKVPEEKVAQEKTSDEAMAEVLEALAAIEAAARGEDASRTSSKESLATISSDDYEQVGLAAELQTDQNGVKRRWFKGFRKV
jgi:hypothetical protein